MAWAKVDDQWWSHPKVLELSLAARGLWISTLSWSCAQRKDMIPPSLVRLMADPGEETRLIDELIDAGLWEPVDRGWVIHDWASYQDRSLSEVRAEAGRKGAEKRWQTDSKTGSDQGLPDSNPVANTVATDGKGDGRSLPYPSLPVPTRPEEVAAASLVQRPPNFVWDAFTELFGEAFGSDEKRRGKNVNDVAVKLAGEWSVEKTHVLRSPDTVGHITTRAQSWPLHFDDAVITEEALAKHIVQLGQPPKRATRGQLRAVGSEIDRREARRQILEGE